MQIRRIVTGHDQDGRAVFVSDGLVEPLTLEAAPGSEHFELWSTDSPPSVPSRTGVPGVPHFFPPDGGSIFRVVTFPSRTVWASGPDGDITELLAEMTAKAPEMLSRSDPDNPEMHQTDSVDYGIVLEGELTLELDDGRTTVITPGCCIVQGGTNHAWRNLTDRPARMAFVMMGCAREG